jgi:hypothetical protein
MSINFKAGLSRKAASQHLRNELGLSYTEATLANMATEGLGPVYRLVGGRAVYMPDDLNRWAATRIGKPVRKAADARRAKHEEAATC